MHSPAPALESSLGSSLASALGSSLGGLRGPPPLAGSEDVSPRLSPRSFSPAALAPVASSPSVAALELYVTAAMDLAQRTLLSTVRTLREPRSPIDPMAALRTVEQLMEALTGFTIGAVLLPAVQRLRQAGNAEVRTAVQRTLQSFAAPCGPAALPVHAPPPGPRFLEDADQRPLVDELGRLLCARVVLARLDARALLRQLVTAAEKSNPAAPSLIAVALHAALDDVPTLAERLGPAMQEAWAHAAAVIDGRPRRSGAWAQWSRRAAGLPEPKAELTSHDVVAAGYVMQIG
jgi:hypothetical protein